MIRAIGLTGLVPLVLLAQSSIQTPSVDKAWQILKKGSEDKNLDDRVMAIRALGLTRNDPAARDLAEKTLNNGSSVEMKVAGAEALGEMGATASIPSLKEAIKTNDTDIVAAAADALYKLEDPAAYNVYYAVLMGHRKTGKSLTEEQIKAIKTPRILWKQGVAQGLGFVPVAGQGVKAYQVATRDEVTPVRAAAAGRLARDPDPRSGEALVTATHDEKWLVRASAARALAKRGDSALLPAVEKLLEDDNDRVRYTAAGAVLFLAGPQAVPSDSGRE